MWGGVPFKEHKRILAHSTTFALIKDLAKKKGEKRREEKKKERREEKRVEREKERRVS